MEISNSYTKNVYERLLELKISGIYSKLKATYVFVFVRSTILDVSILKPKISTRYHIYDCEYSPIPNAKKYILFPIAG